MQIQDIINFVCVAECGNIGKAAEKLFRTYQGVHRSVNQLEKELGKELFGRDFNSFELTEFGKFFKEKLAEPLLKDWANINDAKMAFETYNSNRLVISDYLEGTTFYNIIHRAAAELKLCNPEADIVLQFGLIDNNPEKVKRGEIDIGICSQFKLEEGMKKSLSFYSEFQVFVSKRHHLASKKSLTWEELKKETVLLKSREHIAGRVLDAKLHMDPSRLVICDFENQNVIDWYLEGGCVFVKADSYACDEDSVKIPLSPPLQAENALIYREENVKKRLLEEYIKIYNRIVLTENYK